MKKVFAVVLALAMIFSLSVTAFAATTPSPDANSKLTVVLVAYEEAKPIPTTITYVVHNDQTITYTAEEKHEGSDFVGWMIYRKDGTEAVEGVDYKLIKVAGAYAEKNGANVAYRVAGTIVVTDTTITILPLTDLIVTANYGATITSTEEAEELFKSTAPATGDMAAVCLAVVLMVALAGVCVSKKQLAK